MTKVDRLTTVKLRDRNSSGGTSGCGRVEHQDRDGDERDRADRRAPTHAIGSCHALLLAAGRAERQAADRRSR